MYITSFPGHPASPSVGAELNCPKADGLACPWVDEYNDHDVYLLRKEKDVSFYVVPH